MHTSIVRLGHNGQLIASLVSHQFRNTQSLFCKAEPSRVTNVGYSVKGLRRYRNLDRRKMKCGPPIKACAVIFAGIQSETLISARCVSRNEMPAHKSDENLIS